MSGECNKCDEHALECNCEPLYRRQKNGHEVTISQEDLIELLYWARRYCDGRATYAPTRFNWIYNRIRSQYPDLLRFKDEFDGTLKDKGAYWPYAQDAMYNEKTGAYDARQ